MKAFPMFIRTTGRRVVIVGGGEQAAQKARLLLKTDAELVLVAGTLEDELSALVVEGRTTHQTALNAAVFDGAAMAFIGTGCPGLDAAAHALAKSARCPVNVVDQPALCDLTTPAIVDRDPIVVAIGSEGTAPVLSRDIKTRLEQMLPQNIGGLAALAGRLRPSVEARVSRAARRALWAWVFKGAPREAWVRGNEREAARAIKDAIADGKAPGGEAKGHIALVGAGPGARDLLTLRAVQRLQEADVIFYDRLVDDEVLELARRDAERVFVGKHVGANAWPQDRINGVLVAEALKGRRVVRLKSGDPGIFGRATEEAAAAVGAGASRAPRPASTRRRRAASRSTCRCPPARRGPRSRASRRAAAALRASRSGGDAARFGRVSRAGARALSGRRVRAVRGRRAFSHVEARGRTLAAARRFRLRASRRSAYTHGLACEPNRRAAEDATTWAAYWTGSISPGACRS